jgi:hypothetical protein
MPDTALPDTTVITESFWTPNVRQQVVTQCTSATRPTAVQGRVIVETDTKRVLLHDGTNWLRIGNYTSAGRTGGTWTRAAVQSIPNNTLTNISLDAETADSDGFCTPTSTTITIPTGLGGLYICTASVLYATATLAVNYITINVTGGTRLLTAAGNATNAQSHTVILPLAAADTIVLQTLHNNGGAQNATARIDLFRMAI